MTYLNIRVSDGELFSLQALANRTEEPSVEAAALRSALQSASEPRPSIKEVFEKIDTLSAGTVFTVGEILRGLYVAENLTYRQTSRGAVPSTTAASIGRTVAAKAKMSEHGYSILKVEQRTNVYIKNVKNASTSK